MTTEKSNAEDSAAPLCSLDDACWMVFGGVGAMSPELYAKALDKIAAMTGRVRDAQFQRDVTDVLMTFPCPLD